MTYKLYCSRCTKLIYQTETHYLDPNVALCELCMNFVDPHFLNPSHIQIPVEVRMTKETPPKDKKKIDDALTKFKNLMKEPSMEENIKIPEPSEINEYLGKYVIGQEEARKILSVVASNHRAICDYNDTGPDFPLQRSNILIMGPSGTGKTLMVETLARFLDVPYVSVSATEFSETGYVGKDVTEILAMLLTAANNDEKAAANGIIFIDEIDKILSTKGETRDVSGTGVQHALLRIIEGSPVTVPIGRHGGHTVVVDTKNILFVFGGAFTPLREAKDKIKNSFGFHSTPAQENKFITTEDLMKAGMIREFVGRVHHICTTEAFTDKDLMRVLLEPVDSIIKQHEILLGFKGIGNIDLRKKKFLNELIKDAKVWGTGARGLKVALEKRLVNKYYGD